MPLTIPSQTTPTKHKYQDSIYITHPNHPFTGQTVKVIKQIRYQTKEHNLQVLLPNGKQVKIPISWTNYKTSSTESQKSELMPLLSLEGLQEISLLIEKKKKRAKK